MKGQIFIAGAALFIVLLALIASSLSPVPAMPMAISIASQLDNLAQEYRYVTGLSSLDKSDRLGDLSGYFRDNVQGFDAIYALITVKPESYDLTVGNFLRKPAAVSIAATNSNPATASAALADKESKSLSFTTTGDIQLRINYTIQNSTYSKSLSFATDKNQTIGWFDIGIRSNGNALRQDDVWTIEE